MNWLRSVGRFISALFKGLYFTLRFFVLTVLAVFIVIAMCIAIKYYPEVKVYWEDAVELISDSRVEDFIGTGTGCVYAADGTVLAELKAEQNCEYISWNEIPQSVKDAFVAIEDRRFYSHHGVDWLSTVKAAILLVKNRGGIVRGGSTITQQLVRNVYLTFEQSYERKIKEIFIALLLEQRYSKQQVLEYYINNINYGNNFYGIQTAAYGYFDKPVQELSLDEVILMCAIPNNPTYYDPIKYPKHAASRRNTIAKVMLDEGMISEKEYRKVCNSGVHARLTKLKLYNYEASYAIDCAVREVMDRQGFKFRYSFESDEDFKNYENVYYSTYEAARKKLFSSGYHIYTTIDLKIQKAAQKSLNEQLSKFKKKTEDGVYQMQGAVTVIDNNNGKVVAVVGGRSQKGITGYTLNRAYQSYRQPGSSVKPLIVYTKAFEEGMTPVSLVQDVKFDGGPNNSGGSYSGAIKLQKAIWLSKNSVAWQLFAEMGCKESLKKLQNMQFAKVVPSDYYPPSSLGGMTYGATTVEMASGYAALVNDGVWRAPTCIRSITTQSGNELLLKDVQRNVYSKKASRTMVKVLEGVAKEGTASSLNFDSTIPVMCKTCCGQAFL